ncbi:MAG: MATE family efflux transporter [Bacteroidales bacterium]|nr:MATE family efflux transporter [Candidatus Liminaster caballi]
MDLLIDSRRQMRALVVPIFIELLLVTLMGAADTFMLAQYSDDAVAAVGVANQIITLAFLVFQIINTGTSVLCSQYLGAGKRHKMHQVTAMALLLNLISGIILSLVLSLGAPWLLRWMGLDDYLMQYGLPYMQLVGAFAFFQALHLTISASLRSDHKAIYPMLVVILVNIVNIAGNYSLIFGHWGMPALGVRGAAIATDISRGVAMFTLFGVLFFRHISVRELRLAFSAKRQELTQIMGDLLRIGLPSAGENMSYNAQQLVLTYFITSLGAASLAARVYVINATMFVYVFCICVAQAASIVIGHLVGDKHYDASYRLGWYALRIAMITTMTLSVCLAFVGGNVMSLLTDNPEIITLGATILFVDIAVEAGKCTNIYYTNVLRAVGDVNFPFYVGITIQWLVGVLLGYILGIRLGLGLVGMWCAFICDESIRGLIFIFRWRNKRWQNRSFVK